MTEPKERAEATARERIAADGYAPKRVRPPFGWYAAFAVLFDVLFASELEDRVALGDIGRIDGDAHVLPDPAGGTPG